MTVRFDVAVDAHARTGECPTWDGRDQVLWWVDIPGQRLHRYDPATGTDDMVALAERVGAVALRAGGGLVACTEHGLASLEWPSGALTPIVDLCGDDPDIRCNDAAVDPAGRLWVGTMSMALRTGVGALHRIDADRRATVVLTPLELPNGLAWSPDGSTMYVVESFAFTVWELPFDVDTGALGERRVFAALPRESGLPDGLTVDADGRVWVAYFRGGCTRVFDANGALVSEHEVPVLQPTCPAFAGDDLGDLYLTSGSENLPRADPLAGSLLRARPGATGLAPTPFAG